jgi:SAM-dependent methyltransferase
MSEATNQCAGAFGGVYDFYIEREWISRPLARAVWGVDVGPLYAAIDELAECSDGITVADVPCGAGLALRALRHEQDLRYLAVDIEQRMLERTEAKATARGLAQVETIQADMRDLPLESASVDHLCSFSGIHMINDPERAIAEFARVLKPGGSLIGSSFVGNGSRRQRKLFERAERTGGPKVPADSAAIKAMLEAVGFAEVGADGHGFAIFRARLA